MKINRRSWHCRLSLLGSDFAPHNDNLCNYFWRIVGKLILITVAIIICIVLIALYFMSPLVISNTILIVAILLALVLPALVIFYLREKIGKPIEAPYENIVREYLKAKKRKVCPMIEYYN